MSVVKFLFVFSFLLSHLRFILSICKEKDIKIIKEIQNHVKKVMNKTHYFEHRNNLCEMAKNWTPKRNETNSSNKPKCLSDYKGAFCAFDENDYKIFDLDLSKLNLFDLLKLEENYKDILGLLENDEIKNFEFDSIGVYYKNMYSKLVVILKRTPKTPSYAIQESTDARSESKKEVHLKKMEILNQLSKSSAEVKNTNSNKKDGEKTLYDEWKKINFIILAVMAVFLM